MTAVDVSVNFGKRMANLEKFQIYLRVPRISLAGSSFLALDGHEYALENPKKIDSNAPIPIKTVRVGMPDMLLGGIAINEFLADPNGTANFDTDGNGAAQGGDEFIELVNTSNLAIDISGLELWDAGRDNWFTFPAGSILQPGAFALVVRNVQAGGNLPNVGPDDLVFDADFWRK